MEESVKETLAHLNDKPVFWKPSKAAGTYIVNTGKGSIEQNQRIIMEINCSTASC